MPYETAAVEPGSWNPWSATPALSLKCEYDGECWMACSQGRRDCHGGWDLQWHHVTPGQWYRFEITGLKIDVPSVQDNVRVEVIWWRADNKRADWRHVPFEREGARTLNFACQCQAPKDAVRATLRLTLRWTERGQIAWFGPSLRRVASPDERKVKMAVATGEFPGGSVERNVAFAQGLIARAADEGAQVVCLPECVTSWKVDAKPGDVAQQIPGPATEALLAEASRRRIDVICSLYESLGKLVYNTGVYLSAAKGLLGRYRKVHLSVGERWLGVTPGAEFPVWQTPYGKAGMLICYDNVMAEGHRILSQQGAEVIFLPIMGDPRAVGQRAEENWLRIMQVRAIDHHVWFVVCRNRGDWGLIVRPDGEIVARLATPSGVAVAEVDLNFRHASWIGSDFQNRYWGERRPALYGRLTEDI